MSKSKYLLLGLILSILIGGVVYGGLKRHVQARAAAQVRALPGAFPGLTEITYANLQANPLRGDVQLQEVRIYTAGAVTPLEIGTCVVTPGRSRGDSSNTLRIAVDDLVIPFDHPLGRRLKPFTDLMGYRALRIQAALAYAYVPEQRRLILEHLILGAAEMGDLRLEFTVDNIDPSQLYAAYEQQLYFLMLLGSARLVDARLHYSDASLIPRLIDAAAALQQLAPMEYRRRLIADLQIQSERSEDPNIKSALAALRQFIESPQHIEIRLRPSAAGPLLGLLLPRDGLGLLDRLQVEVR